MLSALYEDEQFRQVWFCEVDVAMFPYGLPADKASPVGEIGRHAGPGTPSPTGFLRGTDVDRAFAMANKIIAVLRHTPWHRTLRKNGTREAGPGQWSGSARRCRQVYQRRLRTTG
ncbi:MAG: hypothetical protein K9M57_06060 [Phycisphaerae bacterium]|nr:hypothetical protein [Phycisphaerae bacterium]